MGSEHCVLKIKQLKREYCKSTPTTVVFPHQELLFVAAYVVASQTWIEEYSTVVTSTFLLQTLKCAMQVFHIRWTYWYIERWKKTGGNSPQSRQFVSRVGDYLDREDRCYGYHTQTVQTLCSSTQRQRRESSRKTVRRLVTRKILRERTWERLKHCRDWLLWPKYCMKTLYQLRFVFWYITPCSPLKVTIHNNRCENLILCWGKRQSCPRA